MDTPNNPQINILIPLYNEEEVFDQLISRLTDLINGSDLTITVIMVDDGSRDNTPFLMRDVSMRDDRFTSVFLSRNFGHQRALTAALSCVDAQEAVLILDGDLQDPPELLEDLYLRFKEGYDIVYAVRKKRKESVLQKASYKLFYRILKKISYLHIPLDTGDFSLISRKVVDNLNEMKEESRFLRGMRSWVGYKQIGVPYERAERQAGDSKYSILSLIKLALNGIFNFSEFPIKLITNLGFLTVFISVCYLSLTLIKKYVYGVVPEGFTGLIFAITLFGGVQLISIGVLGEYILRIFFQVKSRPLFIINKQIKNKEIFSGEALLNENK